MGSVRCTGAGIIPARYAVLEQGAYGEVDSVRYMGPGIIPARYMGAGIIPARYMGAGIIPARYTGAGVTPARAHPWGHTFEWALLDIWGRRHASLTEALKERRE